LKEKVWARSDLLISDKNEEQIGIAQRNSGNKIALAGKGHHIPVKSQVSFFHAVFTAIL